MKLAWSASTRLDCPFEISQLEQVTEEMFDKNKNKRVRQLSPAVGYAVENCISLKRPKLDPQSLRVIVFPTHPLPTTMTSPSSSDTIVLLQTIRERRRP